MSEYFDYADLEKLKASENKILKRVIYHHWQNKVKAGELFEFLDKLELNFEDGHQLILSANEETPPGIYVVKNYDAEKNKLMLLHEFGGRIDLRSEDASTNALWKIVIGKKLLTIGVVDEGDNCYLNNAILLDFGVDKIEINPGMEGLVIEPFEEV